MPNKIYEFPPRRRYLKITPSGEKVKITAYGFDDGGLIELILNSMTPEKRSAFLRTLPPHPQQEEERGAA